LQHGTPLLLMKMSSGCASQCLVPLLFLLGPF
jgi:hypothetical protein